MELLRKMLETWNIREKSNMALIGTHLWSLSTGNEPLFMVCYRSFSQTLSWKKFCNWIYCWFYIVNNFHTEIETRVYRSHLNKNETIKHTVAKNVHDTASSSSNMAAPLNAMFYLIANPILGFILSYVFEVMFRDQRAKFNCHYSNREYHRMLKKKSLKIVKFSMQIWYFCWISSMESFSPLFISWKFEFLHGLICSLKACYLSCQHKKDRDIVKLTICV